MILSKCTHKCTRQNNSPICIATSANCSSSASTAPKCPRASLPCSTRVQPAGVILFARNITGGEQTYKLLKDCQACVSTPLFTVVDMEGGRVDRFRNVIGPALLPPTSSPPATASSFASTGE